jgi:DNA-binding IclR family transcriptional regulator
MAVTASGSYFVPRVVGALELLDALRVDTRTARRMLQRLADEEYVVRLHLPRGHYALTPRLVAVAGQALAHDPLVAAAAPFVAVLRDLTGQVAHLMVPSYCGALCLVHAAPGQPLRRAVGELVPTHCTASGKALLSERPRWRASLLERPLEAHTSRTLTERAALEQQAATIRRQGYAVENAEYRPGMRAVAAPIRVGDEPARAALAAVAEADVGIDALTRETTRVAAAAATVIRCHLTAVRRAT